MAAVGTILVWQGQRVLLVIMGFDILAYAIGIFDNLWNALFDPILVGLAALLLATKRSRRSRKQTGRIG